MKSYHQKILNRPNLPLTTQSTLLLVCVAVLGIIGCPRILSECDNDNEWRLGCNFEDSATFKLWKWSTPRPTLCREKKQEKFFFSFNREFDKIWVLERHGNLRQNSNKKSNVWGILWKALPVTTQREVFVLAYARTWSNVNYTVIYKCVTVAAVLHFQGIKLTLHQTADWTKQSTVIVNAEDYSPLISIIYSWLGTEKNGRPRLRFLNRDAIQSILRN